MKERQKAYDLFQEQVYQKHFFWMFSLSTHAHADGKFNCPQNIARATAQYVLHYSPKQLN